MEPYICDPEPGDDKRILELFDRVFEKGRDRDHWSWENEQNPQGESLIALLKDSGEVRGHLSLQPTLFKVGEEELPGGLRLNSMIEEGWRGEGRFQALFRHLLERGKERGLFFTYGFPNQPALKALRRCEEVLEVAQVPRFVKFYSGAKAAEHLRGTRVPRELAAAALSVLLIKNRFSGSARGTVEIPRFDERFDALWERVKGELKVAVVRDSAYLNWRFADSPNGYRLFALEAGGGEQVRGYVVLYREEERGLAHIADFLAEDREAVKPLLSRADRAARQEGCWALSCWSLDDGRLSAQLKPNGYLRVKSPNTLALVDIRCSAEQRGLLQDPANWYLTIGDSDYV